MKNRKVKFGEVIFIGVLVVCMNCPIQFLNAMGTMALVVYFIKIHELTKHGDKNEN